MLYSMNDFAGFYLYLVEEEVFYPRNLHYFIDITSDGRNESRAVVAITLSDCYINTM